MWERRLLALQERHDHVPGAHNTTYRYCGILLTLRASSGKDVSLSAYLNGLARGIHRVMKITEKTIIDLAGDTGGPDIPVGYPHLH